MTTLYSKDGNEYRTVEVPEDHTLAYAQVEGDEDETFDGHLLILPESQLYATPPTSKVDGELAELHEQRVRLACRVQELEREVAASEAKSKKAADTQMARLKQHNALARIDDFLAGRITHYVLDTYGPPTIHKFEELIDKDEYDRRKDELKLLTLFGKTNGDLEWRVNRYSDGSGSYTTAIPCTSYAEAVEATRPFFDEHAKEALDPDEHRKPNHDWATRAMEYGIELPPEYPKQLKANEAQAKQAEIAEHEAKLTELRGNDPA